MVTVDHIEKTPVDVTPVHFLSRFGQFRQLVLFPCIDDCLVTPRNFQVFVLWTLIKLYYGLRLGYKGILSVVEARLALPHL